MGHQNSHHDPSFPHPSPSSWSSLPSHRSSPYKFQPCVAVEPAEVAFFFATDDSSSGDDSINGRSQSSVLETSGRSQASVLETSARSHASVLETSVRSQASALETSGRNQASASVEISPHGSAEDLCPVRDVTDDQDEEPLVESITLEVLEDRLCITCPRCSTRLFKDGVIACSLDCNHMFCHPCLQVHPSSP